MKEEQKKLKKTRKKNRPAKHARHVLEVKVRKPRAGQHSRDHQDLSGQATGRKILDGHPRQTGQQPAAHSHSRSNIGGQDERKNLIMWSGVSFFMILIVFVWVANIRHIINAGVEESRPDSAGQMAELNSALDAIKDSLSGFEEFKDKLGQLKDYTQTVTTTLSSQADGETASVSVQASEPAKTASTTFSEDPIEADSQAVKKKLEQLEDKLEGISQDSPDPRQ